MMEKPTQAAIEEARENHKKRHTDDDCAQCSGRNDAPLYISGRSGQVTCEVCLRRMLRLDDDVDLSDVTFGRADEVA